MDTVGHINTNKGTGIGAAVRRIEDSRFLGGQGRYVDDLKLPNMLHSYVLRSPHAHARVARVDATAARAAPGVFAVLTREDSTRDGLGSLPCRFMPPPMPGNTIAYVPSHSVLAGDKVRHVGDRVALVVAETLEQAKDAAELVEVDYEALPTAIALETALSPGAAKVWDDAASNLCFQLERGDRVAVDRA